MQKVTVLCVGRLKEKFYTEAAAEYAKRLSRFCKLEITELPEERLPEDPSPAQIEAGTGERGGRRPGKAPGGGGPHRPVRGGGSPGPARTWPGRWTPGQARAPAIWCS